jgi:Tfp pilus assembly PilM family ATPase
VEIAPSGITAARLELRGGRHAVTAHVSEPLPDGAVVASLTGANVLDRNGVASVLGGVLERLGRPRRIGLVLPDPVAKVSLVRFERVPPRADDLAQLVRWQVRKAAPFPIEEAQVSYVPGIRGAEGQEFIVTIARRDVIQEYEDLCAGAGAHAGIVDISTLNVVNAVLAGQDAAADWLLVNVAAGFASIAILRGPHLIFFRSRGADSDETIEDLVHQTAMYYEDRLTGTGFDRVLLCGASAASDYHAADVARMQRSLEARLGRAVEMVDIRSAATLPDRIAPGPALLDALAPLVGLLVRA